MERVRLDFSDMLFNHHGLIGDFYRPVFSQITEWCRENCQSGVRQTDDKGEWGEIIELEFDDPQEAMMFKLMWRYDEHS